MIIILSERNEWNERFVKNREHARKKWTGWDLTCKVLLQ